MFSFGYGPAIPGTQIAFGARAIDDGTSYALLHDRQTWYVDGVKADLADEGQLAAVKAFSAHINREVLPKARETFRTLRESYSLPFSERMPAGESCETVLHEDWLVKVTANTNGSCGYVYLTVALKGLPDLPIVDDAPDDDHLVWSSDRRPPIGARVWHRHANVPATVVGWAHEHGHLFMLVYTDRLTNVMGREWLPVVHVDPDADAIAAADVRCGDYIVLPGHDASRPSRWVGISAGGSLWAKHYPDTSDADVAGLAEGLPDPQRAQAFAAMGLPCPLRGASRLARVAEKAALLAAQEQDGLTLTPSKARSWEGRAREYANMARIYKGQPRGSAYYEAAQCMWDAAMGVCNPAWTRHAE